MTIIGTDGIAGRQTSYQTDQPRSQLKFGGRCRRYFSAAPRRGCAPPVVYRQGHAAFRGYMLKNALTAGLTSSG